MKKAIASVVFACSALASTPLKAAEPAASKHGLMKVDSAWIKAVLANDAAACAALYADDAVMVLPDTGAIKGKKAILDSYASWFKGVKVTDAAVMETHYESAGHVSAGWGAWKVTSVSRTGGAPTTRVGTWCAVAIEKNGVWKYVSDHVSADPFPTPAKR